jgi:hypothetical protein
MKNKKLQKLVEEMLGVAAAEPVHTSEKPKEHTPEVENKDILVGQHAEEVEEVIVEGEEIESEEHKEIADSGEYDYEGDMAKGQLRVIIDAAQELHDQLGDQDNLPEWVQSKITLAKEYIDTARDYMKSEKVEAEQASVQESYTREELEELFEALNLDTHKYTFEFLAEELGFAAAEPVHGTEQPKEHTPEVENKDILVGQHAEEVKEVIVESKKQIKKGSKMKIDLKPVLVEGMRGRPSFKSLRVAPKGSTVVGKEGNLEKIKNLQKKG